MLRVILVSLMLVHRAWSLVYRLYRLRRPKQHEGTAAFGSAAAGGPLAIGLALALVYILLAWVFARVYRHAVLNGLIARYSAENGQMRFLLPHSRCCGSNKA